MTGLVYGNMKDVKEKVIDSLFFLAMIVSGVGIVGYGIIPPYHEMFIALGVAFITAGSVGAYMMFMTDRVAKGLHGRFNEQTEILKEISSTQKEISSTQKEISSTQKEISSTLKSIDGKIK